MLLIVAILCGLLPTIKQYKTFKYNIKVAIRCNVMQENLCGKMSKPVVVRSCAETNLGAKSVRDCAVKIAQDLNLSRLLFSQMLNDNLTRGCAIGVGRMGRMMAEAKSKGRRKNPAALW